MAYGRGSVNKVILIGRLGADPELKYTPSGTAVASIRIATSLAWKDQDGNQKEKTEWHRVVAWRKLAEVAGEWLKKGSLVYVEGRLETRSWDDKDGNKRYMTEIIADTIQMLGARKEEQAPEIAEPPLPENLPEVDTQKSIEDDVPF